MANWSEFINQIKKDNKMKEALESVEFERSRFIFKQRMKLGLSQVNLQIVRMLPKKQLVE